MFALIPLLACGLDTGTDAPTTDDSGEHPVEYGDITLSTSAIDFGYVAVGEWDTEELVITNGGADAIDLLGANIDDAAFSLDVTSGTIEPGDDLVVTVTFEPTTSVDYDGTLSLETTQEDIITVGLTGTAREQDDTGPSDGGSYLDVSWRSHDFGEVDIGKGEVLDLSLSNTGDESLLLVDFASTDASVLDWGKELTLPYVLAPGDTKDVTVLFTPQAEQTYNETLTVQSDADNEADLDLTITGTGFYGCSICSPLISVNTGGTDAYNLTDFLVIVGWTDDTRQLEVWNEGDEDLVIDSVTLTNESLQTACSFSVSGFSGKTTVSPWDYLLLEVTYSATASCLLDTGELTITSNDPYESNYTVSLMGTAIGG
jgi:hypothetical protein